LALPYLLHVSRFYYWPWLGGSVAKCDVDCLVYKLSFGSLVPDSEVASSKPQIRSYDQAY
jgi:hypothetical protein